MATLLQTNPAPTLPASCDPIDLLVSDWGEHEHPTLRAPASALPYLLAQAGGFRAPRTPTFTADELDLSDPA